MPISEGPTGAPMEATFLPPEAFARTERRRTRRFTMFAPAPPPRAARVRWIGLALIVMLVADVFYQATYGLGGSSGLMGLIGHLLVLVYWVYCHLRLQRFLENAAFLVNEPGDLPHAQVVRTVEEPEQRRSVPIARPSKPAVPEAARAATPAPIVAVATQATAPTPRAADTSKSESEADAPRFLR